MKKAFLIVLCSIAVLFIGENLYLVYRLMNRPALMSPISVARQLHLAIFTFCADHQKNSELNAISYPKTLYELVSEDYLSASNLFSLIPQGLWIYNPPNDDVSPDKILLTGIFPKGNVTCTVGGFIKVEIRNKKIQQDGSPNDPQRGSFREGKPD